ncbi:hemerythrin family protein [Desulfotalea psychrophila]|uniref:Related to hemerythrin n=1 Tax=Desulfotalea psychrophila (strain LSv54 / DSM 12343) TaxID=177439 RepID=Q6AMA9_DESPS|nr:hemerythrin family protein [Desulfotalea psychrophila]CAG36516.1 related to hemerythrin [Desulfotalea psychrophila LSv54]
MAVIKWQDTYNTGVEHFDGEHQQIVELIDLMFFTLRDRSGKDVTEEACKEIISYTEQHFIREEQAMRAVAYPYLEEHIAEHSRLKAEMLKLQRGISNNFPKGAAKFYRFIHKWFIIHIQEMDKKYAPYCKEIPEQKCSAALLLAPQGDAKRAVSLC